ncbi:DUF3772 domain-containing protein [Roseovarius salis]|uniref:DUF3772 domain-containing protein n=1 Tax=Roseovarius salis TaxID=3376063 RepID=UPI0037C84E93
MSRLCATLWLCLALLCGAAAVTLVAVPQAAAQDTETESEIDYEAWARTASRAEEAVEAGRASTAALESLRAELVKWRDRFQRAQQSNASTIETVEGQLDALGPPPEEGTESPEIAQEREQLNARLSQLRAPVKKAEVAYSRADGLIGGIDRIIRERQTEQLLEFGPSPVNPVHWLPALNTLRQAAGQLKGEFVSAWSNPVQRGETQEDLPPVVVLLAVGLVLVFRGRQWSRRLMRRVVGDHPGAGLWLAGFAISLGSLVLPFLGVYALIEAVYATGLVGLRTDQWLAAFLPAAFVFLIARWLSTRIFPSREARMLPLALDDGQRYAGRWYGAMLGLVVAGYHLLRDVAEFSGWSEADTNTLLFPFIVAAGLLLLRIAGLLHVHCVAAAGEDGDETYRIRLTRFLTLVLRILSVGAPVLAAVGYFKLTHFLLFPSLTSLLLLGALLVLQRLVVEVYVLVTGNRDGAADSLVPVLIGFLMVLAALPFFALAWGARVADLTELWSRILKGVEIGGTRISPSIFLTFAIVFVIGYTATRLLQGALRNSVLPKTRMDVGGQNAVVSGIGYVGIFLAAIIAITSAGLDLSSIAIVAGALSVGIGFGLQTIVSNFVSGIILLIERPISEGDWIEVGGIHGYVRKIAVRATVVETFDRSDVIVPNSDLVSGRVTNYTRGNTVGRVIVPVGVAYGTDTRKVERILQEVAEAHPMVLMSTPPFIVFQGFGADSLDFEIRAILRDVNWVLVVKSDMNHEIARRFAEEGIEIPFSQREVWLRNPEALRGVIGNDNAERSADAQATDPKAHTSRAHLTKGDMDDTADADDAADPDTGGDGR